MVEEDVPDSRLPQQVHVLAGIGQVVGDQHARAAQLLDVAGTRGVQHRQRGGHDRGQVAGLAHQDEGRVGQLLHGGHPLVEDVERLSGVGRHVDQPDRGDRVQIGLDLGLQLFDLRLRAEVTHRQHVAHRDAERHCHQQDRPERDGQRAADHACRGSPAGQPGQHLEDDQAGGGAGRPGVGGGVGDAGGRLRALGVIGQGRLAGGEPGGAGPADDGEQHQGEHDGDEADRHRTASDRAEQRRQQQAANREPDMPGQAEPAQQQGLADEPAARRPVAAAGAHEQHDPGQQPAQQRRGRQTQPEHRDDRQVGAHREGVDPAEPARGGRGAQDGPGELEGVPHPHRLHRVGGLRGGLVGVVGLHPLVVVVFLVVHGILSAACGRRAWSGAGAALSGARPRRPKPLPRWGRPSRARPC